MAAKMGAPTKLTPELQAELITYLQQGNYICTACAAVGITQRCFEYWMQWGEADEDGTREGGIYRDFFRAATRAMVHGESTMVAAMRLRALDHPEPKAGFVAGDWRAAAEFLQRRYPERWGKRVQETRHTDADGGPLKVTLQIVDERILADGTGEDDGNGHNGDD